MGSNPTDSIGDTMKIEYKTEEERVTIFSLQPGQTFREPKSEAFYMKTPQEGSMPGTAICVRLSNGMLHGFNAQDKVFLTPGKFVALSE